MFRDRGWESFDRREDQAVPAKPAQEAETAASPCHQPCAYDDEGGGRHFCGHEHA